MQIYSPPTKFTSLLALSFYVPAILGLRYLPVIISFALIDIVIGYHWGILYLGKCFFNRIDSKLKTLITRMSGALFEL